MAPVCVACRQLLSALSVLVLFVSLVLGFADCLLTYDRQTLFSIGLTTESLVRHNSRLHHSSHTILSGVPAYLFRLPTYLRRRKYPSRRRRRRGKRSGLLVRLKSDLSSFPRNFFDRLLTVPESDRRHFATCRFFLKSAYTSLVPVVSLGEELPAPRVRLLYARRGGVNPSSLRPIARAPRIANNAASTKMALVNARSLRNKTFILNDFFTFQGLDLLCVTETWACTGAGGESPALYVTEGDDVTLPCKNVLYPNCSSTTWIYAGRSNRATVELVAHGKIKDPQKHRRLSLLTDCSLHINNVSAEDAGLYTCQQLPYVNGPLYGDDTAASLSVLTVRKSQSGGAVTLQCLVYTFYGPGRCDHPPFHTVILRWVSDTDPPGQRDPSSQTHTDRCNSTLRINHPGTEKDQTEWRCQLLDKGEVKLTSRPDSPEDNNDHKETTLKTPTHTGSLSNHTNHRNVCAIATGAVLPLRLSFFFLALIVPLVTGAAVYTKRKRSIAQRSDCTSSVSFHRRQADE